MTQTTTAIQEAREFLKSLNENEEFLAIVEAREKIRMNIDIYRRQVYNEGKKEGCQTAGREIARKLLQEKISEEVILNITGLSFDEIMRPSLNLNIRIPNTQQMEDKIYGYIKVIRDNHHSTITESRAKFLMDLDCSIRNYWFNGWLIGFKAEFQKFYYSTHLRNKNEILSFTIDYLEEESISYKYFPEATGLTLMEIKQMIGREFKLDYKDGKIKLFKKSKTWNNVEVARVLSGEMTIEEISELTGLRPEIVYQLIP